ncbi:hypothetical protein, partial [Streptococcus suis]
GDGVSKPAFSTASKMSSDNCKSVNFNVFSFLKGSAKLPYLTFFVTRYQGRTTDIGFATYQV